jgi:hypothetical protein
MTTPIPDGPHNGIVRWLRPMKSMRGFRTMSGKPHDFGETNPFGFLNEINEGPPVSVTRGFGRTNPIGLGRLDPAKACAGGTPALRPGILAKRTDLAFPNEINQCAHADTRHIARDFGRTNPSRVLAALAPPRSRALAVFSAFGSAT